MRFMVMFLILCGITFNANAKEDILRNSMVKDLVNVTVTKDFGRVVYDHSKSRSQFSTMTKKPVSKDTLGLTLANLQIEVATKVSTSKVAGGYLAYLSDVNVKMYYGDIIVLIDKKYKRGTCQYEVIAAHEDKHVEISRTVMNFYAPYIQKEIEKIIKNIEPEVIRNPANASSLNIKYSRIIQNGLNPMLALIEEQLDKGNSKLDTPEEYKKESAKCDSW